MFRTRILFLVLLFFLGLLPLQSFADPRAQAVHVIHQLISIKARLDLEKTKRHYVQLDLRDQELRIGHISQQITSIERQIKEQHNKLAQLEATITQQRNSLQQQRQLFAQQIQAAYVVNPDSLLKLILNEQDISKISRMMTYYQYLARSRITSMQGMEKTLQSLKKTKVDFHDQYQKLLYLNQERLNERERLQTTFNRRTHILQTLNHDIQTTTQKAIELEHDQQVLMQTLKQLADERAKQSFMPAKFAQSKGHLPWPTVGKILNYFGTKIHQSELRWGSDIIEAKEGQNVNAIAAGKIVFANWLSTYGLLIIIDHGNGYMTLYGRNQSLYKHVGDSVTSGDVIASVGQSGGYQKPALYFAIRHNGQPLNPADWCSHFSK